MDKYDVARWKFNLSRYWNKVAFSIIRLGKFMIWDSTGMNTDYLDELWSDTAEEILTSPIKKKKDGGHG